MDTAGFNSHIIQFDNSVSKFTASSRTSGGGTSAALSPVVSAGSWHTLLAVFVLNVGTTLYMDGELVGTATCNGSYFYNTNADPAWLGYGAYAPAFRNSDASIALGAIFKGDLRAQGESLTRNPWQIFKVAE